MRSLLPAEPPRLFRSVGLQAAVLVALAIAAERPWARHPPPEPVQAPKPSEPPTEPRIRVVQIPRPPPPRTELSQPPKAASPPPAPQEPPPPAQRPAQALRAARPVPRS